ncbi:hypothetical protein FACS189450_14190 [Spirochaetia bacterium]|nr:hypothetical protein FACS189450_14190 [Spirochaetia bacterium]
MKRLFVVGDSISMHYGPYLQQYTEGRFLYDRKRGSPGLSAKEDLDNPSVGSNGGDSRMVLQYLQKEPKALDCDVFLFNCGLHDIKIDLQTGALQVSLDEYKANLEAICLLLAKRPLRPVWVRSTPVDDIRHAERQKNFGRKNADLEKYNAVAGEIMERYHIPEIDLYGFTKNLGPDVYLDHIHYIEDVRRLHAAFIAGGVLRF